MCPWQSQVLFFTLTRETAPFSNDYFVSLRALTFAEAVCQTRKLSFICLDSSDPEPCSMHSFLAVQCLYFLPNKEEDNEVEVQMSDWVPLFLGFSCFLSVSLKRDSTCLSDSVLIFLEMWYIAAGNSVSKPVLHFSLKAEIKSLLSIKNIHSLRVSEANSVKHTSLESTRKMKSIFMI